MRRDRSSSETVVSKASATNSLGTLEELDDINLERGELHQPEQDYQIKMWEVLDGYPPLSLEVFCGEKAAHHGPPTIITLKIGIFLKTY
jgi:hypothetical protein